MINLKKVHCGSIVFCNVPDSSFFDKTTQLGYRDGNNTWDAWTVKQYEKYIRELVLFGCNSIENIPFQGNSRGENMKLSPKEMNAELSNICHNYGLDYAGSFNESEVGRT